MKTSRYWTDAAYREAVKKRNRERNRERYADPVLGAVWRARVPAWQKVNRERMYETQRQWIKRHGGIFKYMYRSQRCWAFAAYRWMLRETKRELRIAAVAVTDQRNEHQ